MEITQFYLGAVSYELPNAVNPSPPSNGRRHDSPFEPKISFPARRVSSAAVNLFRETLIKLPPGDGARICNYNLRTPGSGYWSEATSKTTAARFMLSAHFSDQGYCQVAWRHFCLPNRKENFFFLSPPSQCVCVGSKTSTFSSNPLTKVEPQSVCFQRLQTKRR